jgi:CRISPR-associated protein Csm2
MNDYSKVTAEQINNKSDQIAQQLAQARITTHQIRNIYSAVQRVRALADQPDAKPAEINRRLIFLKPKLAYATGRQGRQSQDSMKVLQGEIVQAIDGVVHSEDHRRACENFFFFMESIVAYHKFHGGRD